MKRSSPSNVLPQSVWSTRCQEVFKRLLTPPKPRLPFLTHHEPELGWELLANAFREPQGRLWLDAERFLYFQYRSAFGAVRPLLDRIRQEAPDVAGEPYGRIVALSYLAGQGFGQSQGVLSLATTEPMRRGFAQVFCANLHDRSSGGVCRTMIAEMLRDPASSAPAAAALGRQMANEKTDGAISLDLALTCVEALAASQNGQDTWGVFKWLERNAIRNPLGALEVCERIIAVQKVNDRLHFSRELVVALLEILREADETDDPALIARAVGLQDEFLKRGIVGVDALLESSTLG